MTIELKTPLALITGGTDGLGKAGAIRLARNGYRVCVTGRNAERRAAMEQLAREQSLPITAVEMDVREEASMRRALDLIYAQSGLIDVLVNNAGVGYYAVMEEISMEHLREQFETNFFSVVRLTQLVLPQMRARRHGRIVNVSSIAGRLSFPLFGPYSGSKFALEGMSDALRLEVHPFGIDVVLIEPGFIPTGFQGAASELSGPYVAKAEKSPYAQLYKNYGKNYRKRNSAPTATPEHFADVLLEAVQSPEPRARYTVTPQARWLNVARRFAPDRLIDGRIRKRLNWKRS
jgi:NAD(P)-dependent dehydrogenase (short-subunit alcohol dehydrogenase family)